LPFIAMAVTGPDLPLALLTVSDPIATAGYTGESLTGLHAIAEAAAIALVNQIRGQERNEARDGIMIAMAKLAESRDPETGAHLERVQNYCRLLAEVLAGTPKYRSVVTPEFINTLVWSCPLHDIGKVGIPDDILLKPGRLTPPESDIMKRHAAIGGDTIRALIGRGGRQDFLLMAMEIAYSHHEKYDGSGYPHGLAGGAIPLPARIASLADVYDALRTVRVYKPAFGHTQSVEMIRKESGTCFDPDIVRAFLQREQEFEKLAAELADSSTRENAPAGGGDVLQDWPRSTWCS
jgi:response regulator RpfG family c-di-GMP phosphodiesterase